MSTKTISIPEDSLVEMLKTLSERKLVEVFWKSLVKSDTSILTKKEKKIIKDAKAELEKKETVRWENLR